MLTGFRSKDWRGGATASPEVYAEWHRRQGHTVLRTASSYWYSEGYRVFQAFPYHWLIQPDEDELRDLFLRHRVAALRYSAPALDPTGCEGYHVLFDGETYGMEALGQWARKNVRRGLKNCTVGRISYQRFLEEGWRLRADTLDRQKREAERSGDAWRRKYVAAADLPGFETWGALVDGNLAAFLLTFRMGDCLNLLHQQCRSEYLREHVNNALSFVVTQTAVSDPSVKCVFYGVQSLDAPASVDEFKFRMGYARKLVRQCVAFHPVLAPFANRVTYGALRAFERLLPRNRVLAKAEGMVRLFRGRACSASAMDVVGGGH